MCTNPAKLLPVHRQLLGDNFDGLDEGSAVTQKYWIVDMESELSAAKRVQKGYVVPGSMPCFNKPMK